MISRDLDQNTKDMLTNLSGLLFPLVKIEIIYRSDKSFEVYKLNMNESFIKLQNYEPAILKRVNGVFKTKKAAAFFKKDESKSEKISLIYINTRSGHAVLALRFDITVFEEIESKFKNITSNIVQEKKSEIIESNETSFEYIKELTNDFCFKNNINIFNLSAKDRRKIVLYLSKKGVIHIKNSVPYIAKFLGTTRASIYNYLKS